jgi:N-acetyl-1-D-myo-inositol-2-amino-2-deoxy-alpha-D-glucopyranoside deacetylase
MCGGSIGHLGDGQMTTPGRGRRRSRHPGTLACNAVTDLTDRRLMTVHAHPDDESLGTGGTMARVVATGGRVVLVTCTRGELGEIVVPELDTPANHRRLGEIRMGELEDAMGELGVTEWENLGYRDSGMMGTAGNADPRSFWQADLDEAIRRLVFLVRRDRPHVMTTYNEHGGYGHPDHIRTHQVAVGAFERAGDAGWYPDQLEGEGGLEPWAPAKLYEQVIPASVRAGMTEALARVGRQSWWAPPENATPEELAAWEEQSSLLLVPDDHVTTWVDVGAHLEQKWRALERHVTQISADNPIFVLGLDGWREFWSKEAFILRASHVETALPEDDLFAGLTDP